MSAVIQLASSGRAKCRGCNQAIAKGELRCGEELSSAYGAGNALIWFHLVCAAHMRPETFMAALRASPELAIAEREWLERVALFGLAYPAVTRLVCAERAPSGRARCRQCRGLIDLRTFRFALQLFEEGRFEPVGYLHVPCAEGYFGTREILERVDRLSKNLTAADLLEIAGLLEEPAPAVVGTGDALAKTQGEAELPASDATTPAVAGVGQKL